MEVPSAINRKTKVMVGICTFRRPAMLQRCITSVMQQERPDDWQVEILVVDNDAQSDLGHTLDNVQSQNGYKLHYVIERNRGIPYARNAVCTYALQQKSDFVLFIDDDEEAAPGWLMAYGRAASQFDAEAYTGPVRFIFLQATKTGWPIKDSQEPSMVRCSNALPPGTCCFGPLFLKNTNHP